MDLMNIFTNFGPWGLVCFLVWKFIMLYTALSKEVKEVRDNVEKTLLKVVEDTTETITKNTSALEELKRDLVSTKRQRRKKSRNENSRL